MILVVTLELVILIFRPVEAAAISASIMSNGRVHYVDGASHWVNFDKPDEVNRVMKDFLEEK